VRFHIHIDGLEPLKIVYITLSVKEHNMRKIMYIFSASLDGFIESAAGDLNWSVPSEELHQHFNDLEREIEVDLYGRRLYENMAAYWPTADQNPDASPVELEFAQIWKSMPKVVFSKTLEKVDWNTRLVRGNLAEEVERLKQEGDGWMSVGGAGLAASFIKLGLVDEYRVYVHPVILGGGKPMFPPLQEKIDLELVETHTFDNGVVMLRYRRVENR
jgi:dihydrofolate reductase